MTRIPPNMQISRSSPARLAPAREVQNFAVNITADRVVNIDDRRYLIHFRSEDVLSELPPGPSLCTVFHLPSHDASKTITWGWLNTELLHCQTDDVFHTAFLQSVIFHSTGSEPISIEPKARELLERYGTKWISLSPDKVARSELLPGPYIVIDQHLREVWRLHRDTNEAFTITLQPGTQESFQELRITTSGEGYHDVAVPSRLRVAQSDAAPLQDLRIAVKDNFHMRGVKTSLCNRAYYRTYERQPGSATAVKQFIKLGCLVLGKTKLSSFGVWEEPIEYIDYQAPWNPRADGYQSPGGSSSGSAAAIAAYEWLDVAIGADTSGSIMRPALWAGVFGVRPSHSAVSNEGIVPSVPIFDAPCFMSRDLELCHKFACNWYGDRCKDPKSVVFNNIIWPSDYWLDIDADQEALANTFFRELEKSLNCKRTVVSFHQDWKKQPPVEAGNRELQEYMAEAMTHMWYDDYNLTAKQFRKDHWRLFDKEPYVSPPVRKGWDNAETYTKAQRDEAHSRLAVFKRWFHEQYVTRSTENIFIIPIEILKERYRDEPLSSVIKPPPGINCLFLSPALGAPEIIVPIDTWKYTSRVSYKTEELPFAVGLMAAPGTDLALIEAALKCLKDVNRPTRVHVGKTPFKTSSNATDQSIAGGATAANDDALQTHARATKGGSDRED